VESCNTSYTIKGYLHGYLIGELDLKTVNDLDIGPLEVILNMDTSLIKDIITDTEMITAAEKFKDIDTSVAETEIIKKSDKVQDTETAGFKVTFDKDGAKKVIVTDAVNNKDKVEVIDPKPQIGDTNKMININTIYFDFDKYNIRYDARLELDKIAVVLKVYPEIEIDVNAHTDSRGKNSYNFTLSDNRAKATTEYLVKKGIDPKRISGKGYGELQLATNCPNGVPCTGFQHQLNRRSEFSINQNGLNDVTFTSRSISGDKSDSLPNSGAFVNYNFENYTTVYTVQLGAFHGNVQTKEFNKLTNLFNHRYNDGFNRYFAGIFETSTEARNYMRLMRKKGFEEAFVVGLKGKDRF
jgi:outer membrane protein OmpA-like peptidoglycan-associated protein